MHGLHRFYGLMTRGTRRRLLGTVLLMPVAIVAEMVTIGAVWPLLAIASGQDDEPTSAWFREWLMTATDRPLVAAAAALALAALTAAAVRLLLVWTSQGFVTKFGHEIAAAIFRRMLHQPYDAYLQRNSSEFLSAMEKVQRAVFGVLQPAMQGLIAAVIAVFIAALLCVIDPLATLAGAASVAAAYAVIHLATRRRLRLNSQILAQQATQRLKIVQESLGGIRDIILEQSHEVFERQFRDIDSRYRHAAAANAFIGTTPRYVVEASVIVAILTIVLVMSARPGGLIAAIPVLGALALGAQRLLPLVQQAWIGWSSVSGNLQSMRDVAAFVEPAPAQPRPRAVALPFSEGIVLDRVSYRYQGGPFALRDVSLRIDKGERIGIAGATGSGKSTLLDIMMGLLKPDSGAILVDGRLLDHDTRTAWQAAIAHVPQSVFLADDTIAANIAFAAVAPIDRERLEKAAQAAQLTEFIAELPDGYETTVGERGMRLSGGQRQRIGIARALYKNASLLILDEATNALDGATEADVMRSIAELPEDLTIIIATHRSTTLAGCGRLLRLQSGSIVQA